MVIRCVLITRQARGVENTVRRVVCGHSRGEELFCRLFTAVARLVSHVFPFRFLRAGRRQARGEILSAAEYTRPRRGNAGNARARRGGPLFYTNGFPTAVPKLPGPFPREIYAK